MRTNSESVRPARPGFFRRMADAVGAFIRRFLPRQAKDPMRTHDETFEPVDVDALRAELRLVEEAKRYGDKDLPASGDGQLDGPQERIRQRILGEVDEAYRRANREAERLSDALRGRAIETLVGQALSLPRHWVEQARMESRGARNRIAVLEAQRNETYDRLRLYRERYQVGREPALKEKHERRLVLAGAILLAVFQALANSVLFAQGMDRGLSQAWLLAVIIGVLDIAWHFGLGSIAPRVQGHRWYERVIGGSAIAAVAVTIPIWNIGLVHLRLAIQREGVTQGMETWFTSMVASPFGFSDFISFLLLGSGVLCSFCAVVAAWNWDEPIPEYRRLGKKLKELDASLGYWRDHDDQVGVDLVAEAAAELKGLRDSIDGHLDVAEAIVRRMERLMGNLESFLQGAHRDYAALIRCYRDENRHARSTAPPAYFDDPVTLEVEAPLKINLEDLRAFLAAQRQHRDRLGLLPNDLAEYIRARIDGTGHERPAS